MSFWQAEQYQEDVCALGDVLSQGLYSEMGYNPQNYHILARAASQDSLKRPKSARRLNHDLNANVDIWELETDSDYVCLGDVVTQKGKSVDLKKYCCVREDLTVIAGESELMNVRFPTRDLHDTQGLVGGHFINSKENWGRSRTLRLLRVDGINVQQSFDMRGPKEREIKLQEVDPVMVFTLDKTGKNTEAFSVWRPDPNLENFHRFGDIITRGVRKPNLAFVLEAEPRTNFFISPVAFLQKWTGHSDFLKAEKVTIWEPSCPSNYQALGEVITTNAPDANGVSQPVEPLKSAISCVHNDYITTNYDEAQDLKISKFSDFLQNRGNEPEKLHFGQNYFIKKSLIQYIAEKPIVRSKMVEVKYDLESKSVDPAGLKSMRTASVINRSYFPQCATRSYEFTVGESSSFEMANEVSLGASLDVGLPGGASTDTEFSFSHESSEEKSEETTTSVDATLEMPEDSRLSVAISRQEYTQKIPFRSVIEKTYVDGTVGFQTINGIYKGVSTSEIVVDYGEIKFLNAPSRYEDSPGLIYKYGQNEKIWQNRGSENQYTPPYEKQPVGIWGPSKNIEEGFCSLGDVAVKGYDYPEVEHLLAHAIQPGALVPPIGFFEEFDDTGSGVDTPVTFYDMLAPCGYTCLGSVAVTSRTERPDREKYCCVNNEYLTKGNNEYVWNNIGNKALRESSIWWNVNKPDSPGIYAGNFMAVTGHGSPYAWLAYILTADRIKPHIHYMFGDWESFGRCSADCGWGEKTRYRACQEVNLKTMQTLRTGLDAQLCIDANAGQEGVETAFCKVKDCLPCGRAVGKLGAFMFEEVKETVLVMNKTLIDPIFKYPAPTRSACENACGSVAGCLGFIFNDPDCDLVLGEQLLTDDDAEGERVTVGKLSKFCGQKFAKDIVQVAKFSIELPGMGKAGMEDLISNIMKAEIDRNDDQAAGVWRFREDAENNIFYSTISYYEYDFGSLVPVTKVFIREKPGQKTPVSSLAARKRRDASGLLSLIPSDVEVGEIGPTIEETEIVSADGDVLGTCDSEDVCTCIDGYQLTDDKDCENIDECTETEEICGSTLAGFCFDNEGSYECQCNDGFEIVDDMCKDIDECSRFSDLCSEEGMICVNNDGSYHCACDTGFVEQSTMVSGIQLNLAIKVLEFFFYYWLKGKYPVVKSLCQTNTHSFAMFFLAF